MANFVFTVKLPLIIGTRHRLKAVCFGDFAA